MFWIGFGAGTGAAFLITMLGLCFFIWMPTRKDEDMKAFRIDQRRVNGKLFSYWEVANGNQEELIEVLKDISNQIRK